MAAIGQYTNAAPQEAGSASAGETTLNLAPPAVAAPTMLNDLANRLEQEADDMTCYASTTKEYRPNATAKLLREAALAIRMLWKP